MAVNLDIAGHMCPGAADRGLRRQDLAGDGLLAEAQFQPVEAGLQMFGRQGRFKNLPSPFERLRCQRPAIQIQGQGLWGGSGIGERGQVHGNLPLPLPLIGEEDEGLGANDPISAGPGNDFITPPTLTPVGIGRPVAEVKV